MVTFVPFFMARDCLAIDTGPSSSQMYRFLSAMYFSALRSAFPGPDSSPTASRVNAAIHRAISRWSAISAGLSLPGASGTSITLRASNTRSRFRGNAEHPGKVLIHRLEKHRASASGPLTPGTRTFPLCRCRTSRSVALSISVS